ncbi:GNAT family N-acetyltransferase [Kribbella sp. NPDC026611]|uniref:GNAT family N-acetyltransferase n=1 Tax=Kribbella sp. NPDC026611 TaxID=3154911 RepID=UPI0033D3A593
MTTLDLGPSIAAAARAGAAAADAAGVELRELRELAELDQVYRLYDSIWRPDPKNPPVTTELLRALTKAGNYVGGAYDGDELVGACVGFFSAPAEVAMHSHVAGVSGLARGRNVGFALKLHQRTWAMQRGVSTISWTFDPLVRRNAYFNVVKLAAQPAEYLRNFYGDMRDGINSGDDTDRLLVRWELGAPAVASAAARHPMPARADQMPAATIGLACGTDGSPRVGSLDGAQVLVAVPADIERLRRTDPAVAKAWRGALREVLGGLLADGARVTGFDRNGWYVLEREGLS